MNGLFIGLMSGTSIDAVDAALVDFAQQPKLIATHSHSIDPKLRQQLLMLSEGCHNELTMMLMLDHQMGALFAETTTELLKKAGIDAKKISAIGSHGQTIRHYPESGCSLQIGDANLIAEQTGITTVADFRRRDLAAGGEGAPLVPAFHNSVFRSNKQDRVIVNIGGIANITHLPAKADATVSGFDTGPGNMLLDGWAMRHLKQPFDENGTWGKQGKVDQRLLQQMLQDSFFSQSPPKSTGREHFNIEWLGRQLETYQQPLAPESVQATLCQLTARSIAQAITEYCPDAEALFICGGGAHNETLMQQIQAELPKHKVTSTSELGISPDWVEAIAFAWLAKETLAGRPGNLPAVTGASRPVVLGSIHSCQISNWRPRNKTTPTQKKQIEALISGNAVSLVEDFIPRNRWCTDSYREVFTIKLTDIINYLEKNYSLEELANTETGDIDGFYALPTPNGYETYEQERGFKENNNHLTSANDVWKQYAEYIVNTSGTGLDFK